MRLGQLRSVKIGALRRIPRAALADFIATVTEEPRVTSLAAAVARTRCISMATAGEAQPPSATAPTGAGSARKRAARRKPKCCASCETCGQELNAGLPVPDDRQTVAAFLDRWLMASLRGQVSEKTLDSYADTVRLHIKPSLGRKLLRKLTVSDVDQLLAWKRKAGYSANTVRIIRAVLRRSLRQAERESLVLRNAAALSAAPRIRSDEGRALSVSQARALLEQVQGSREEPLLTVIARVWATARRGAGLAVVGFWTGSPATPKVTHAVKRVRDRTETSQLTHASSDRRAQDRPLKANPSS